MNHCQNSSLPHRQLRKDNDKAGWEVVRSLPHRQLRKSSISVERYVDSVHCRIGSLEMSQPRARPWLTVHCRTGSLEI